jgi:hypothetical protein
MLVFPDQNADQNRDINIGNRSFENVLHFRYMGTTVTNQNVIQEEIKKRSNSGNACYHSVQNLMSCCLLSKNVEVGIYKATVLPVVLYGCETWSLTLREEHELRAFESRVLRRIFGPKRDGVMGGWRKLHNEELHDLYSLPSIIRIIKLRRMRWAVHVARMEEKRSRSRSRSRSRCRWIDKIKKALLEIGLGGVAQDRYRWRALGDVVMNLQVP